MKKITKLVTLTIAVMMLAVSLIIPASAADLSKDGVYTVPVALYHASKEKLSKGNDYIIPTAIITVENGKKYITVVADGVDDLTFSYYLDGSTEGNYAEATKISNVEINGKSYSAGYKFPLVTDNTDVGVKFKAPVMPVSPSARLRIDYSGLKAISVAEETTEETQAETTGENGETAAPDETSAAAETAVSGEAAADETTAPAIATGEVVTGETVTEESSGSPAIYIVIAAAVIAAVIIAVVIKKKKS